MDWKGLPPPSDIPSPPASSAHKYKIDWKERVVRADFSNTIKSKRIDPVDEVYVLGLFEKPDVTVVIKGLADGLDPHLWSTRYLDERCGEIMYHNFRRFTRSNKNPGDAFVPVPERENAWSSMRLRDFVRYLDKRADAARSRARSMAASPATKHSTATLGETEAKAPPPPPPPSPGSVQVDPEDRDGSGSDKLSGGERVIGKGGGGGGGGGGSGASAAAAERREGEWERQGEDLEEQRKQERDQKIKEPSMRFVSYDGKFREVELLRESVYLTDMDLTRYLPECANNLMREFKMDILPAGARCAMQHMPRESRPFLGPNLYVTPPGSWTQFHQDGNGTVDSGHQCLVGRNRVIMLRRLDREEDKHTALSILTGGKGGGVSPSTAGSGDGSTQENTTDGDGPTTTRNTPVRRSQVDDDIAAVRGAADGSRGAWGRGVASVAAAAGYPQTRLVSKGQEAVPDGVGARKEGLVFEAAREEKGGDERDLLYRLPHCDGTAPPWPSDDSVEKLREMNFCPSVFTLEPGEFVHINKARLHAFRKEKPLPHEDPGSVCVSVAWDWVFKGVTEDGRKGEMSCALQCAIDNRKRGVMSLAPVESCLFQVAKASLASFRVRQGKKLTTAPHTAQIPAVQPPMAAARVAQATAEACSSAVKKPSGGGAETNASADTAPTAAATSSVSAPAVAAAAAAVPGEREKSGYPIDAAKDRSVVSVASSQIIGLAATGEGNDSCTPNPKMSHHHPRQHHHRKPSNEHATVLRLVSQLTALVQEGTLDPEVINALRGVGDPRDSKISNGSSEGKVDSGKDAVGDVRGSLGCSVPPAKGRKVVKEGNEKDDSTRCDPSLVTRDSGGKVRHEDGETTKGTPVPLLSRKMSVTSPPRGLGDDSSSSISPQLITSPPSAEVSAKISAPPAKVKSHPDPGVDVRPNSAKSYTTTATTTSPKAKVIGAIEAPAPTTATVVVPSPTGLEGWISSPRTECHASFVEGAGGKNERTEATAMAVLFASANEILEKVPPAAAAAEAAAIRRGGPAATAAAAAAAARGATASARLATAASFAAMQRVTPNLKGGGSDESDGADGAGVSAAVRGAVGEDLDTLVALAPMLEELTSKQRRDYQLQLKSAERLAKAAVLNPSRTGKRKLGPVAARARDAEIAAQMAAMVRSLKKAVEKVEVDTSVPTFLEKINPFSSDSESFNCASCKGEIFNAYMHCYGCETILQRDLTLCLACHAAGKYGFPTLDDGMRLTSDLHHCPGIPERTLEQRERKSKFQGVYPPSRCDCKEPSCRQCHLCVECACDCHERYQLRYRFEHPSTLEKFVKRVRDAAGGTSTISRQSSSVAAPVADASAAASSGVGATERRSPPSSPVASTTGGGTTPAGRSVPPNGHDEDHMSGEGEALGHDPHEHRTKTWSQDVESDVGQARAREEGALDSDHGGEGRAAEEGGGSGVRGDKSSKAKDKKIKVNSRMIGSVVAAEEAAAKSCAGDKSRDTGSPSPRKRKTRDYSGVGNVEEDKSETALGRSLDDRGAGRDVDRRDKPSAASAAATAGQRAAWSDDVSDAKRSQTSGTGAHPAQVNNGVRDNGVSSLPPSKKRKDKLNNDRV